MLDVEPGKVKIQTIAGEEVKVSKQTKENLVGAVSVHESTHATDKGSMKLYGAKEPEKKPEENELKHYKQLDEKKKQE